MLTVKYNGVIQQFIGRSPPQVCEVFTTLGGVSSCKMYMRDT